MKELVIKANDSKKQHVCALCKRDFKPFPAYGLFRDGKPVCMECGFDKDRDLLEMLEDWLMKCRLIQE
jgi:hypothetical protein